MRNGVPYNPFIFLSSASRNWNLEMMNFSLLDDHLHQFDFLHHCLKAMGARLSSVLRVRPIPEGHSRLREVSVLVLGPRDTAAENDPVAPTAEGDASAALEAARALEGLAPVARFRPASVPLVGGRGVHVFLVKRELAECRALYVVLRAGTTPDAFLGVVRLAEARSRLLVVLEVSGADAGLESQLGKKWWDGDGRTVRVVRVDRFDAGAPPAPPKWLLEAG